MNLDGTFKVTLSKAGLSSTYHVALEYYTVTVCLVESLPKKRKEASALYILIKKDRDLGSSE